MKLLRVTAPPQKGHTGFVAGAEFEKTSNGWKCVRAAPIIKWMERSTIEGLANYFRGPAKKAGWKHEWL